MYNEMLEWDKNFPGNANNSWAHREFHSDCAGHSAEFYQTYKNPPIIDNSWIWKYSIAFCGYFALVKLSCATDQNWIFYFALTCEFPIKLYSFPLFSIQL